MKSLIVVMPLFLLAQGNYSFGPSIRVNDDSAGIHFHTTTQRSIACFGDTVYLVWRDDRYEVGLDWNPHIFFSKSTDAGNIWSSNILIDQNLDTLACFKPHMAIDGQGGIYVVYCSQSDNDNDRDVYFTKSTDGGISFTIPIMVNDSAVVPWQTFCACAVDSLGQNIYVVWEDTRNSQYGEDIYLARSADGGVSFLPSQRVNDDLGNYRQWYPVAACDNSGQNVYVAWQDFRDTLYGANVFFARSTNYGQTLEINYCVNDTTTTGISKQGNPSIYYKNSIIYLAWRDERYGARVYSAKSVDNGVSFELEVQASDDSGIAAHPSITVDDSGNVYVVWYDSRTFGTTGYDIYFSFSDDSGQTFQPNVRVNDLLGNVTAWDMDPAVAVSQSGRLFVSWDTDRNDPSHTYFDIYLAAGAYVSVKEAVTNEVSRLQMIVEPTIFVGSARIIVQLSLPDQSNNEIIIYDTVGRRVKQLNHIISPSTNRIIWDGTDEIGSEISAGVYFIVLNINGKKCEAIKVIKTK